MRRTVRYLMVAGAALLLCACASESRRQLDQSVDSELPADTPESRLQVHMDLIRRMLDQNQYYAALAHVQGQVQESGATDELRLLEAEARRKLGQTAQAQALYRQLLKSPQHVPAAYHGLGLTNVSSDPKLAIWQLQQAVQRRPADAEMRNDLGYALMLSGRYAEAMPELSTAVELEAGRRDRARNNLVLLMLVRGDEAAVNRLAQQSGMSADTLAGLRRQAQSLIIKRQAPAATQRRSPQSSSRQS